MRTFTRRTFLKQSAATAATISVLGNRPVYGAGEKIVVGVMGLGGRGSYLAEAFARHAEAEVGYLCDPDNRRLEGARPMIEAAQGRRPKLVQDFRRILEDKSVQVLVNATPDHWHALGSVLACQAGKDVYVEKPMAHNVWEGRQMIEAAHRYQRIIQVGMQTRSAPYMQKAVDYIQTGQLGAVHLVRVYNMMQHGPAAAGPPQEPPATLDYELWCGPAAKLPYSSSRNWLNFYEYSSGPIPGDAIHQLDLARMILGDPPCPKSVSATGAIRVLRDGRDTPDTQLATFEYENFTLLFESALWTPYMKKIPAHIRDSDLFPDWPFTGTRIEVFGTKAFMYLGRHGGGFQVYNDNSQLVHSVPGRQGNAPHIDNFLACVRSRQKPNADVEHGHSSALLCHLANIACRVGNQRLVFDAATESFPASPEANQHLKRASYREPWIFPA